jgi:hypothetical protein
MLSSFLASSCEIEDDFLCGMAASMADGFSCGLADGLTDGSSFRIAAGLLSPWENLFS